MIYSLPNRVSKKNLFYVLVDDEDLYGTEYPRQWLEACMLVAAGSDKITEDEPLQYDDYWVVTPLPVSEDHTPGPYKSPAREEIKDDSFVKDQKHLAPVSRKPMSKSNYFTKKS